MDSPQRRERRDFRFPLHLPVLIRIAQRKEMHTRSENISLGGILLSSAILIPEGATVEVSVGVSHLADPGILLSARGRVLRVRTKDSGDFAVAIKLEGAFTLPLAEHGAPLNSTERKPRLPEPHKIAAFPHGRLNLVPAWHTET
jgi:hypothetical protein